MRGPWTTRALAVVAAAAMLVLSGCSSTSTVNTFEGKSAQQILDLSKAAAAAAGSVHVAGSMASSGSTLTLDLSLGKGGVGHGTVTAPSGSFQLISDGTSVYVKADAAFWTQAGGEAFAKKIGDKWVVGSVTDANLANFASMADFSTAVKDLLTPGAGTLSRVSATEYKGAPAVGLSDGAQGTLWIAATDEPLPLAIEGGSNGTLTFTEWGSAVTATAPPSASTVDVATLG